MMGPPAEAIRSPDGYYWWDETAGQWQPIEASASSSSTSDQTASTAADPTEGGGTGVAEHLDVEGTCEGGELSGAEIDEILAAAGVSTVES